MDIGKNFPISHYYREHIVDAETITRGGGWWTAVLLINDPVSGQPFLSIYRWQLKDGEWKTRKNIGFKTKKQTQKVVELINKYIDHLN